MHQMLMYVNYIYEIYFSKFTPNTTFDDIRNLITDKPLLNHGAFEAVKLVRREAKLDKLSFVSFKISTTNKTVYDSSIKNDVWSPNSCATKFVLKQNLSQS